MNNLFVIVDKDGNFAKTAGKHKTPAFQSYGMANYRKQFYDGEGLHVVTYIPNNIVIDGELSLPPIQFNDEEPPVMPPLSKNKITINKISNKKGAPLKP